MTDDIEAIIETGGAAAIEVAASALAERGTKTEACANCGNALLGPYCAVCGQPKITGRRSVHTLIYAFVKDVVNFDSRIMRTARALMLQPGELPAAFREGRTQPYVPSIRLYLFVSLVFFVLLGVTGIALFQIQVVATRQKVIWVNGHAFIPNPAYDKDETDPDVRKAIKPLLPISNAKALRSGGVWNYSTQEYFFAPVGRYHSALPPAARAALMSSAEGGQGESKASSDWFQTKFDSTLNRIAADPAALNTPVTNWLPRALFLLLPLYAFLLALFHIRRRKDYYLVDHLVFSFSIHTFAFVALLVAVGLAQILDGETVALVIFAVLSIYIFLAMKRFYAQGWVMTAIKFILVSGIYTVFFLLPALLGILALSMFGVDFG